jgi:hypothetical protein
MNMDQANGLTEDEEPNWSENRPRRTRGEHPGRIWDNVKTSMHFLSVLYFSYCIVSLRYKRSCS